MKRFKNILYVADRSKVVLWALHQAVDLAERNKARLTILLVMEEVPSYLKRLTPHALQQAHMDEQKAALDKLCDWVAGRVEFEAKVIKGMPFLEVIREVLRSESDLLIKSANDNGGAVGRLFGTTDMHLLRKCPCPVWLIKSDRDVPFRRILAAVDFGPEGLPDGDTTAPLNQEILELAGSLAHHGSGELHCVHVWDAPLDGTLGSARNALSAAELETYVENVRRYHERWMVDLMAQARTWLGADTSKAVKPRTHLKKGRARQILPAVAEKLRADLVVMGTVARAGIEGFLIGNTAESVLARLNCSVLAVKPPGFATPVALPD